MTVPRQLSLPEQDSDQYLDGQVMLLGSQEVAVRAVRLANAALGRAELRTSDFFGGRSQVRITPPLAASPGSYGASIVAVAFTWSSPRVARVAVDAVLQSFDATRTASIAAQGAATIAGIDRAIAETTAATVRTSLLGQRSQVMVNVQIDLAHHPVTTWATDPVGPGAGQQLINSGVGLLAGAIAGAALAYARVSRRRRLHDPLEAAACYRAPLISEIPVAHGSADRAVEEAFRLAAGYLDRMGAGAGAGNDGGGPVSVAVMAVRDGPGGTAVVAGLARALADGGTTVLAVDASGGGLGAALASGGPAEGPAGGPVGDGFRQVLSGHRTLAECVPGPPRDGVPAVLGPGPDDGRVSGAARRRAVQGLLAAARSRFEIVLIDGPPLLESADAVALAGAADAVVVVARHDEPLREHLELAERLHTLRAEPLGVVYDRAPTGDGVTASRARRARHVARRVRHVARRVLLRAGRGVVASVRGATSLVRRGTAALARWAGGLRARGR